MRLILASTSPRRREILSLLALPFEVIAPEFDERPLTDRPIEEEVLDFAVGKAQSVARHHPKTMIVGSDTMILIDATKIGKPDGIADAKEMLRLLSGKTHRIFTSVAILDDLNGPGLRFVQEVSVKMRDYSAKEIEHYLSCDESLDKAGAYSIQGEGRNLVESIRGDYLAAVGLPLKPIADYLKSRGISVPSDIDKLYSAKSFLNWQSFS
jgi:septum formation protein